MKTLLNLLRTMLLLLTFASYVMLKGHNALCRTHRKAQALATTSDTNITPHTNDKGCHGTKTKLRKE